eukprot:1147362-Pelagomonas_calceolata.AAC.8
MTDPCEQPLCKSNTLYNFGPATNSAYVRARVCARVYVRVCMFDKDYSETRSCIKFQVLLGGISDFGGHKVHQRWPNRHSSVSCADPDNQLYGSARPGAQAQRCYNPNDVVTVKEGGERCFADEPALAKEVLAYMRARASGQKAPGNPVLRSPCRKDPSKEAKQKIMLQYRRKAYL